MKLADSWAQLAEEKAEVTSLPMELPDILEGVRAFLSRYIVFSNEAQAPAVTLWAAHTWVIGAFYCTPYLHVSSPVRECGKSRLFGCLKHLCRNPWLAISPSEAVLFRKIHADSPTILLDEIDTVFFGQDRPEQGGRSRSSKRRLRTRRDSPALPWAEPRVERFFGLLPQGVCRDG